MRIRSAAAAFVLVTVGLTGTSVATAPAAVAKHACTKASSGHCIQGGQFCPKAKKGKAGWDAAGRRYVCKGAGSHPHWRK